MAIKRNNKGQFIKGIYLGFGFKKGNHPKTEFKKGQPSWNKGAGVKVNCLICKKVFIVRPSRFRRGRVRYCSYQCRSRDTKYNQSLRGRKMSKETIDKLKHTFFKKGFIPWNKGKPSNRPEVLRIRNSQEYKDWRRAVFERDNYTCVWCHKRGGVLHADHIKKFAYFPSLRFSIDNGRTLCAPCHRKTDTYGNKGHQSYKQS